MEKSDIRYQAYVSILEEELKPAMGCTEPIAIAYCAAVARRSARRTPGEGEGRSQRQHDQERKIRDRPEYGSFKGNPGGGGRQESLQVIRKRNLRS